MGNVDVIEALLSVKTVLLLEVRDKVLLSNGYLFDGKISGHMDDFNSVQKGLQHIGDRVGGTDEDALREVELNIKVVVSESI